MKKSEPRTAKPRWTWAAGGPRLFGSDGVEYHCVSSLWRVEVERLLTLDELETVTIDCGAGVTQWVGPKDAPRLWLAVERDLDDVVGWRPPPDGPGTRQYEAQLWRSADGHHIIVFVNE